MLHLKMPNIVLGNLELDRDRFYVLIAGQPVELTYIQFEVLNYLAANANRVVDRDDLLRTIWHSTSAADARKLRIQISRLRKKIAASHPWRIETVTKRGYALVSTAPEQSAPAPPTVPATANGLPEGGSL